MAHKFHDNQQIQPPGTLPYATGEVEAGEKMFWIAAFVYQSWAGHYAAASGTNQWGAGVALNWNCPTQMAPGSQNFKVGTARAWALALVSEGPRKKYYGWGHAVELV